MPEITLRGLLSVIQSSKTIKVNLFNADSNLLIISFDMDGYAALEDQIEESEITKLIINNPTTLDIYIKQS